MTEDLGKYLGVPIFHKRVGLSTFKFVIDKVNQRLSAWKARTLSFAGRVTLAKSVVQAMPTYVMQACELPRGICDEVDKLCRNFIWGDEENHRKIHLISWEKLCMPKKDGGLGLRSTRQANSAFLQKGLWDLCSNTDSLWGSLVRNKYNCGRVGFPDVDPNKQGSNYWRGMGHEWERFRDNLIWELGNGEDIKFWEDRWIPNYEPLITYTTRDLDETEINISVSDCVLPNGEWNMMLIENALPIEICYDILAINPPSILNEEDKFLWRGSPDGNFSTKSAYKIISEGDNRNSDPIFELIWRWKGPERIRTFLWKLAHEALLTNSERTRRHMATQSSCSVCGDAEESLLHRFRDCCNSFSVWSCLEFEKPNQFFRAMNWKNWMMINLKFANTWSIVFGATLDQLWRNRNEWIFSQKATNTQASVIKILHQVNSIAGSNNQIGALLRPNDSDPAQWCWIPPPSGSWKINCDGSVSNQGRVAGCGGIIRSSTGDFVLGYSYKLRNCSVLQSELLGVLYGLRLALDRGIRMIVVETDSVQVVELLSSNSSSNHPNHRIIEEIKDCIDNRVVISWNKIDRNFNYVADVLAKYGAHSSLSCNIFNSPPDFLSHALNLDRIGLCRVLR